MHMTRPQPIQLGVGFNLGSIRRARKAKTDQLQEQLGKKMTSLSVVKPESTSVEKTLRPKF